VGPNRKAPPSWVMLAGRGMRDGPEAGMAEAQADRTSALSRVDADRVTGIGVGGDVRPRTWLRVVGAARRGWRGSPSLGCAYALQEEGLGRVGELDSLRFEPLVDPEVDGLLDVHERVVVGAVHVVDGFEDDREVPIRLEV
jgi:hypothetical protein